MQRYFINQDNVALPYLYITGEDCHHIKNVMRMKISDKVYVTDTINSWVAKIISFEDSRVILEVVETLDEHKELKVDVTIAQGLVRREKAEEVVDYITELGARYYLPVSMERSIVKVNKEQVSKKTERMQKIAKEASEQSHRTQVLEVMNPVSFKEFIELSKNYDLCLFAFENSNKDDSFKKLLQKKNYKNILILVGPEGGISEKEVEQLKAANFYPVTLGPRILRTQVAPLYIMSAIGYEWEDN